MAGPAARPHPDFIVDLDGFEGPIDLLLSLAREQKVDLAKISVLQLAEQYLAYIQEARDLKLEIAADYLVTAAWLAYLKSRLLLPDDETPEDAEAHDLADQLARRLQRLDAIRRAGDLLLERPRLGIARFARPQPEGLRTRHQSRFHLALHDLLQAYLQHRLEAHQHRLVVTPAPVIRVEDALRRISRLLGGPEWRSLWSFLPAELADETTRRSALAASFAAGLELAKDGVIELRQTGAFGPIFVRRRP